MIVAYCGPNDRRSVRRRSHARTFVHRVALRGFRSGYLQYGIPTKNMSGRQKASDPGWKLVAFTVPAILLAVLAATVG